MAGVQDGTPDGERPEVEENSGHGKTQSGYPWLRPISRRDFLKIAGATGAAIGIGGGLGGLVTACEESAKLPTDGDSAVIPITAPPPLDNQPDAWVQTGGPTGGPIHTVELHPDNPDTLFAGGNGGVYKSVNGGASWTKLGELPSGLSISRLLVNPLAPEVMYAFGRELHKTTDGGETWTRLFSPELFSSVAMDPADPDRLLLGRKNGEVRYSSNAGRSWEDISPNLPGSREVPGYAINCLAFGQGQDLWAGTGVFHGVGNGLLYRSRNGGRSWNAVEIPGQDRSSEIHSIFVDPENPATVYVGLADSHGVLFDAATDFYLVKTTDAGANWTRLSLPFTDVVDVSVYVIGRAVPDTALYVGSGISLFFSDDGGTRWTEITPTPGANGEICDIAVDPRDADVLYVPRRTRGIVKSMDRGKSWVPINEGILNTDIPLLALGNGAGSTMYVAALGGEGTFRSFDWGESWENVTDGGISHPFTDELAVSPVQPATVWEVADVGQFFVSHDHGSNWEMTVDPRGPGRGFRAGIVQAVAAAPSDPSRVYAVKSGYGIFRSLSGGHGWDFLHQSEVDYTYGLAVHPTNPDVVFSGYNPKPFQDWAMVRRSTDGGDRWETVLEVPHSGGITSVEIDPRNPNVIYAASIGSSAGGGGQIYRSDDGGDTWEPLNSHFTMLTVWGQPQLIGDPGDPSTAYVATWLGGTWKTTDAGQTWMLLDQAPQSCTALSLDPAQPEVIYAADRTEPTVWKSTDSGATWTAVADFSSDRAFLVNRVLMAGEAVYAATFGPGMHDGRLYVSRDGGVNWEDITNGLPRSVLDVAVDTSDPAVVYVTTHIYGAYKSTDGGTKWSELKGFPNIGGYDIETDPADSSILYAAGMGACTVPDWVMPGGYTFADPSGVYKSTDGGRTWANILTTSNECRAVRVYAEEHNMLFASALSDGFFVSADGGANWVNVPVGLDTQNLTSVWACGNRVYVGTQGCGVYAGDLKPATGSVRWAAERSNKPVPDVHSLQIKVDPTDSARLYVGSNPGGLLRSDDGGRTWGDKNFLTPSVVVDDPKRQGYYTFAINQDHPSEVWVGTWGRGVYKSYDGHDFNIGANGKDQMMLGKHVNALAFHPHLGVLAATEEGVFVTADGGTNWEEWNDGLGTPQTRNLAVLSNALVMCGTAGYELYQLDPSGPRWEQLSGFDNFGTKWPIWDDRPLYQYSQLLFHPTDPDIIYFGTFPAGIFKSLDGGETWREYNVGWLNDGVFTLVCHPKDPNIIYAGTYNGLNRSLDAAAHWERWDQGWPDEQWVFSIDFDPTDPDVMYACSKNGENEGTGREDFRGTVMKSTDGGAHWEAITAGLDPDQEFYKIIVDKADHKRLYLVTQLQGVRISYNGGASWEAWNEGLTNPVPGTNGNNVTNTMALSDDGRMLYFGSAGSGVFRRTIAPG